MIEINNKTRSKINLKLVNKVTEDFLKLNNKERSDVSIVFVGDKTIRKFNKIYRGIDMVTDVLSFNGENNFLGEIVIDYTKIKKQAKVYKNSVQKELVFILVHGLLHLLGYDDKTERGRKKMEKLGTEFVLNYKL